MACDQTIARYRWLYAQLLSLYPQAFHERFGEQMEQTFHDLCRERTQAGQGLFTVALWVYCETFLSILKESPMPNKSILRVAIGTGLILLIPLYGNLFVAGWNWPPLAFVVCGGVLFGAGLTFEWVASKGGTSYRLATGIAVLAALVLVWMNAAAGIIGDENPANLLYFAIPLIGFAGAYSVRFQPQGMARVLVAMALAQLTVPVLALLLWRHDFAPGVGPVFVLTAIFVTLWLTSAGLFRAAATKQPPAVAGLAR